MSLGYVIEAVWRLNVKKILNVIAVTAVLALSAGAFAQGGKTGMKTQGHMMAMATKWSGMVKGAPTGKTFMLAMKGKPAMMVDASKADVRMNGKFFSIANLKGGSIVSVEGSMMKDHLMATKVDVKSVPGKKK